MKVTLLIGAVVLVLMAASSQAADKGFALKETIWTASTIPVCWESLNDSTEAQRSWVQSAVARTWEANSSVRFAGWGECAAQAKGIRIAVRDVGPYVVALGSSLDGVANGMVLNFTYNNWSSWFCVERAQFCSDVIAVHEFGHALGFAHEQNRVDTPATCTQDPQGTSGDTMIGAWDLDSVMNYCNPNWNGSGNLSATDIEMVERFYPKSNPGVKNQCNWYGTLTPLCSTAVQSGWGWENEKSCVSISTCLTQPFSSSSSILASSSSSSVISSRVSSSSVSSAVSSSVNSSSVTSSSSSSRLSVGACKYSVSSEWSSGFTAVIRITNNSASAINGWSVNWAYTDGTSITNSWNAAFTGTNPYTATSSFSWNSTIQPGQFVEIGFNATKGTSPVPQIPVLNGSVCN